MKLQRARSKSFFSARSMPGKKKAEVDELDDQEFRNKNGVNDDARQAV
jgi:hypothetical protein